MNIKIAGLAISFDMHFLGIVICIGTGLVEMENAVGIDSICENENWRLEWMTGKRWDWDGTWNEVIGCHFAEKCNNAKVIRVQNFESVNDLLACECFKSVSENFESFLACIQNNSNRTFWFLAYKFWFEFHFFRQRQISSSLTSNNSRERKWGWKKCQSALHDTYSIGYK